MMVDKKPKPQPVEAPKKPVVRDPVDRLIAEKRRRDENRGGGD